MKKKPPEYEELAKIEAQKSNIDLYALLQNVGLFIVYIEYLLIFSDLFSVIASLVK